MNNEDFFKRKTTEYIQFANKKDLEGTVFEIVDYKLVKDKEQYGGNLADTYEVTVFDGTKKIKFDVAYSVSRKSGEVNEMFQKFSEADAADHFIPTGKMTMFKNVWTNGHGYNWVLVKKD